MSVRRSLQIRRRVIEAALLIWVLHYAWTQWGVSASTSEAPGPTATPAVTREAGPPPLP